MRLNKTIGNSMAPANYGHDSKDSKEVLKRQIKHKREDSSESGKKDIID